MIRFEEVTITKVYRGNQLVKKGTPDEKEIPKVAIKTEQYPDKWISAFVNQKNADWLDEVEEGKTMKVGLEQNGDFLNLHPVDTKGEKLNDLTSRVDAIEKHCKVGKYAPETTPSGLEYPEAPKDDIPF